MRRNGFRGLNTAEELSGSVGRGWAMQSHGSLYTI